MTRTALVLAALGAAILSTAACSSGDVPVGSAGQSDQKLQKGKNGGPTGNGQTCSWDDAVSSDGQRVPAANGQYHVGDQFKSPDGCNSCSCTDQGIACTDVACSSPPSGPQGCPEYARICQDGKTAEQRANCVQHCPEDDNASDCPAIARICNDGSTAQAYPTGCQQWCPEDGPGNWACQDDAKVCPDGSAVGRRGPQCEFAPCPGKK